MVLNICNHDCTELWDGVLYKQLSNYPEISSWEMKNMLDFIQYEKEHGRTHDPEDFFHFVMFAWGNCQAGDRLVMERKMKRFPTEEDMGVNLTPGVRFYFEYDKLDNHPQAVHDGFLPIKVKDEVVLADYVYAIIVPNPYRELVESKIPATLLDRVFYIENDCKDVWDWSEKVYTFVEHLEL